MCQVEFRYNEKSIIFQCNESEKICEICNEFILKEQIDKNNIYFSYNGKIGKKFDEELTFSQIINSIDKEKKNITILVYDINGKKGKNSKIKSKYIICPKCGENINIYINNYKITLYDCKNGHRINNLSFDEFEKTQYIDISKIICNICKEKNKGDIFNNEFYKCEKCNINICPLCKLNHDKNHNIINYEQINYICGKHNEKYIKYCNKCKMNICMICEEEHKNHENIYLGDMIINENELKNKINELNKDINKLNNNINEIINILNEIKENINKYYIIIKDIINNYDIKNRNYKILYNIKEIYNNNDIIKDINKINNENNIINKFNYIYNIYKEIKNEIKLKIKIEKEDINKDIYFLDNTNGDVWINGK